MEEVILNVKDINLSYNNKNILNNINFEVVNRRRTGFNQGQIISLIGKSGIGKSQLFRIISGFNEFGKNEDKNLTGQVLIGVEQKPVQLGNVGVVTQNYKLLEHRTVRKNLEFTNAKTNDIDVLCKEFDLYQHLDKFPLHLSGGQRQRAAIIQQVLTGNDFILLDEPFSGLDEIMLKKTIDLLLKVSLLDEMKTLIIVSHDIENSLAISDTAFLMTKPDVNNGAIILNENKFDLVQMGLAWTNNIKYNSIFRSLLQTIKNKL